MTSFEDRARAEAERRYYGSEYISGDDMMRSGAFVLGALWAREQEPTEAQVEAAARALSEWSGETRNEKLKPEVREAFRRSARAALLAAKGAGE